MAEFAEERGVRLQQSRAMDAAALPSVVHGAVWPHSVVEKLADTTATLRRRRGPGPWSSARSGAIEAVDWRDADRKGWLVQVALVFLAADLH